MRESAVLTTAMSSMSMAVAAQTTARVQRWVRIWGSSGEVGWGTAESVRCPHPPSHRGTPAPVPYRGLRAASFLNVLYALRFEPLGFVRPASKRAPGGTPV